MKKGVVMEFYESKSLYAYQCSDSFEKKISRQKRQMGPFSNTDQQLVRTAFSTCFWSLIFIIKDCFYRSIIMQNGVYFWEKFSTRIILNRQTSIKNGFYML